MNNLVKEWRRVRTDPSRAPYLFSGDEKLLTGSKHVCTEHKDLESFNADWYFEKPDVERLHVNLIPMPYMGDLEKASIFLLMLNPGLSPCDYFAEYGSGPSETAYRTALVNNLRQQDLDDEFPFLFLNPKFSWHSGFKYWHDKLRRTIDDLTRQYGKSQRETLSLLAQNVACLQFVPYHSRSLPKNSVVSKLRSSKAVVKYARGYLAQKAANRGANIIVLRGKDWGLHGRNITPYDGGRARAASLGPESEAGKRIKRRFKAWL